MRLEPLANDIYHSPHIKVALPSRFFPSLLFYSNLLSIVWNSSRRLQRQQHYVEADKPLPDSLIWTTHSLRILRALEKVGVQFEISGLCYLKNLNSSSVFIANHMSMLEALVLPAIIQPFINVTFVVKESLINYPIFGPTMRAMNPVVVGRDDPRADLNEVLQGGTERIHQGCSMIIFPQNSRSDIFEPEQFNTLGIKLAKKSQATVVPLALQTDAWGNGKILKDLGPINPDRKVRFCFGEPMQVEKNGKKQHQETIDFISAKLECWRRE